MNRSPKVSEVVAEVVFFEKAVICSEKPCRNPPQAHGLCLIVGVLNPCQCVSGAGTLSP